MGRHECEPARDVDLTLSFVYGPPTKRRIRNKYNTIKHIVQFCLTAWGICSIVVKISYHLTCILEFGHFL
jgi:hypothetical protein